MSPTGTWGHTGSSIHRDGGFSPGLLRLSPFSAWVEDTQLEGPTTLPRDGHKRGREPSGCVLDLSPEEVTKSGLIPHGQRHSGGRNAGLYIFKLHLVVYCGSVHAHACMWRSKDRFGEVSSPSTMRVSKIELRSSGFTAGTFTC